MVSSRETPWGRRGDTIPSEVLTTQEDGLMKSLEKIQLMRQLDARGVPILQIARLLSRSRNTVKRQGVHPTRYSSP